MLRGEGAECEVSTRLCSVGDLIGSHHGYINEDGNGLKRVCACALRRRTQRMHVSVDYCILCVLLCVLMCVYKFRVGGGGWVVVT